VRRGAPAKTGVSSAASEYQSMMRSHVQRWKSLKDLQSSPEVDWSPRANRRVGWRHPRRRSAIPTSANRRPTAGARRAARTQAALGPPDTIRVAFIRIDFLNDRAGPQTTGDGKFDLTGPDTTIAPIDRPPHNRNFYSQHLEALRRYYDAESYGRVVVVGDVWPRTANGAYSCNDMADFDPGSSARDLPAGGDHVPHHAFAADSQSTALGDRIPWDSYDRFMVIHAGSDFQSDLRGDSPLDIPSFTVGLSDTDVVIFSDSTTRAIDRASFVPETANQDGFYGALNGVIAHENGHSFFGFADIYDIESGFPVVGLWSLMDSGNLAGSQVGLPNGDIIYATGLLPPSVDPFQRFFIGDALHFVEPAWSETTTVRDVERHPDVSRVFLTSDEYLLLENRSIAAPDTISLDQDSTSRVILGPKSPDRYEYDALLPGPGILVWHIDASVIPFYTAFRVNPDYGFNSNPGRPGMSIVEADGLGDLGDPGSPFILGSPLDPFFLSNCPVLADSTIPPLTTHIGTRPHMRFDFLDDPDSTMRFIARRLWLKNGWPVAGDFPPGGPQLLAVDADGDRTLEVCWAGGASGSPDSTALFAVRANGRGINDSTAVFARLNRRPRPLMAALPTGEPGPPGQSSRGPSYFAVSTYADGPDTSTAGGRVYLLDHHGNPLPGWPAQLPTIVTTPPVIAGGYPNATVYVGGADGRVYAIGLDSTFQFRSTSTSFFGPVTGRLAVDTQPPGLPPGSHLVAAGDATGQIAIFDDTGASFDLSSSIWPQRIGSAAFDPEFLWIDFDGQGKPAGASAT
jgi:M6 family metalloprotease-like protein